MEFSPYQCVVCLRNANSVENSGGIEHTVMIANVCTNGNHLGHGMCVKCFRDLWEYFRSTNSGWSVCPRCPVCMTESIRDFDDVLDEIFQVIPSPPIAPPPPPPPPVTAAQHIGSSTSLENHVSERETLERSLEDSRAETRRLRHQTTQLTESINFLTEVMRTGRRNEDRLRESNDFLRLEKEQLDSMFDDLKKDIESVEKENDRLRDELRRVQESQPAEPPSSQVRIAPPRILPVERRLGV